jgi:hypothetical protein
MAKKRDLPAVLGRRELTEPDQPVAPRPRSFAWLNRIQTTRVKAYTDTVDATTGLLHSLSENARAVTRLRGIQDEIDHDRLALEVHTESLKEQHEDIQWSRERKQILRDQERQRLLNPSKNSTAAPPPQEPEDVDLGDEED